MESFSSGLSGATLVAAITLASDSLQLSSVPSDLKAGAYSFKLDSELVLGTYRGAGATFSNLQRGLEGTAAASHRAGIVVYHTIRGDALNALTAATRQVDPRVHVRSAGQRAFLAINFN